MIVALILFLTGLGLSGFFSGTETGLYRVSRTRLILDGLSGSRTARAIVWLLNHPAIYVATMLIGNNLANYLTSAAVVMGVVAWFGPDKTAELAGPILLTPMVFVLGELMPKYLFYRAPYQLTNWARPGILLATVLFAPLAILLGGLGQALQKLTGQTPFRLRLMMSRGELDRVLRDGHEAGILQPGQRTLAANLFEFGNTTAASVAVPVGRLAAVDAPIDLAKARHQARRRNHPIILVRRSGRIVGFLWYADLCVREPDYKILPVVRARVSDRHLRLLLRMYDAHAEVAVLYDERNQARAIVTRRQLISPLIRT